MCIEIKVFPLPDVTAKAKCELCGENYATTLVVSSGAVINDMLVVCDKCLQEKLVKEV